MTAAQPLASQVYDLLMADIEPDLLLAMIPTLDKKYAAETPTEREKRMVRYSAAYKKFDEAFQKFSVTVGGAVRTIKKDALHKREQEAASEEEKALGDIAAKLG